MIMILPAVFLLLQLHKTLSANILANKEYVQLIPDYFTSEIYMKNFLDCSLVYVYDTTRNDYRFERSIIRFYQFPVEFQGGSYIVPILPLGETESSFKGSREIHRLLMSNRCSLVIFLVHKVTPDMSKCLFHTLTPLWDPLTKKDENYYVFLGSGSVSQALLMSSEFGLKLKYKISIELHPSETSLFSVNTVAPYSPSGNPELVPLLNQTETQTKAAWTVGNLFPDLTLNHFGRRIKMSVPRAKQRLAMNCDGPDKRCHPVGGSYKFWILEAMKKWNFSYDLFESSLDGGTGIFKNGTWLGAVGDVLYEEAEMGFWVGKILSRHKFVEWSAPLSYEWMIFSCHKPKLFFSPKAIIKPFSSLVWMGSFLTVLLVAFFTKFLIRVQGGSRESLKWQWRKLLEYTYSVLLEQDAGSSNPTGMRVGFTFSSIRTLCAFWLIFSLVMSNTYKAKLVSLIAFPMSSWVPDTFEELAISPFRIGLNVVGKGGAAYDLFRSSSSPTFKKIFHKMELLPDALKCLKEAEHFDMCCCLWAGTADYLNEKNMSDKYGRSPLQQSSSYTFFIDDGIIFQKKAIFRKQFDITIWNAVQMGLISRWQEMDLIEVRQSRTQWERETNQTERTFHVSRGPEKLKVFHFIGAFAVLTGGVITSFLLLLYEYVAFKKRKTQFETIS